MTLYVQKIGTAAYGVQYVGLSALLDAPNYITAAAMCVFVINIARF